ncbi:hydrogenase maturation protease [Clostridium cadaveris]|uniref:hydrogenase maturation protease n=1 Tax=Clostridium cadaveris TaxID=1529 RepID=UPI001E65AABD|nr:hydrogenase maturation protease [Clostridium cadaveris]UFH66018.1 hydrogenase maturation protease [Clostridium cadaveris]
MIKIIGIGNILMGDDGIGVKVVDVLEKKMKNIGIEFIKAETDVDYALDNIKDGDFLFIIDSTSDAMAKYGEIIEISLEEAVNNKKSLSIHNVSLISEISSLNIKVNGIILAIKAASIEFNIELSMELKNKFSTICNTIYGLIEKNIFEYERNEKRNA